MRFLYLLLIVLYLLLIAVVILLRLLFISHVVFTIDHRPPEALVIFSGNDEEEDFWAQVCAQFHSMRDRLTHDWPLSALLATCGYGPQAEHTETLPASYQPLPPLCFSPLRI